MKLVLLFLLFLASCATTPNKSRVIANVSTSPTYHYIFCEEYNYLIALEGQNYSLDSVYTADAYLNDFGYVTQGEVEVLDNGNVNISFKKTKNIKFDVSLTKSSNSIKFLGQSQNTFFGDFEILKSSRTESKGIKENNLSCKYLNPIK